MLERHTHGSAELKLISTAWRVLPTAVPLAAKTLSAAAMGLVNRDKTQCQKI